MAIIPENTTGSVQTNEQTNVQVCVPINTLEISADVSLGGLLDGAAVAGSAQGVGVAAGNAITPNSISVRIDTSSPEKVSVTINGEPVPVQ